MNTLENLFNSASFKKVLKVQVSENKGFDCETKYIITPKPNEVQDNPGYKTNLKDGDVCIIYVYGDGNMKVKIKTGTKSFAFYHQPYSEVIENVYIKGVPTRIKKGIKFFLKEWILNLNSTNPAFKYHKRIANYQSYQSYTTAELYRKLIEGGLL